ncbi:MAG: hypothetical protein ACLP9L_12600 [Thermoguttaceae bacterium]
MADEIELPQLVVKTGKSQFRLRCHAAAWAGEYGGKVTLHRRHSRDYPGLLLLSATGPDTAIKSARATLYQPDIDAEFQLDGDATREMLKARATFDGKAVTYKAAVMKLAPGVIHLVALANIPGLMPNMSDDHLWTELSGPRYTTPLLRSWIPWMKQAMVESKGIVVAHGYSSTVGVLKTEPDELDVLVASGVKEGHLRMVA